MTKLSATPAMVDAVSARLNAEREVNQRQARQLCKLGAMHGFRSLNRCQLQVIVNHTDDRYYRNEALIGLMGIAGTEENTLLWRDIGLMLVDETDDRRLAPRVLRRFGENSPLTWMNTECLDMATRLERGRPAHKQVKMAA